MVRGTSSLGLQGGSEADHAGMVPKLGGQGSHGDFHVDVGVQLQRLSTTAVEGEAHDGTVPAGQVCKPLGGTPTGRPMSGQHQIKECRIVAVQPLDAPVNVVESLDVGSVATTLNAHEVTQSRFSSFKYPSRSTPICSY